MRLTLLLATLACSHAALAASLAITHVNVVDVETATLRPDHTIVAVDGEITLLGPSAEVEIPADTQVVDASGLFAIPGLWDMHVHLSMATASALPVLLANGVSHVRDMGSPPGDVFPLRARVVSGEIPGPQIFTSGPILENTAWLERVSSFFTKEALKGRIGIASVDEVAPAIDGIVRDGADFIKMRTVASRDVYFAVAAECRRRGLALTGHAPPPAVTLQEAVEAGQRSIEHYIDGPGIKPLPEDKTAFFAACKHAGTHFVPTMISGVGFRLTPDEEALAIIADTDGKIDPRMRTISAALATEWKTQIEMKQTEKPKIDFAKIFAKNDVLFRQMHQEGIPLMTGTDLGAPLVFPGYSLHDELAMFVEKIGMSPAEALRAATIVPAKFMQQEAEYGTITPGKKADIVLLRANPLERIEHVRDICAIILSDRYFDRAALDALLDVSP